MAAPLNDSFTSLFRHVDHRLSDPEEYAIAVSGSRIGMDFLAPQRLPGRVEQFQTPRWTLDFHETHVKARVQGPLPPGWASLGLMRSPCDTLWHGRPATRGVLVCTPPGESIDGRIMPGFDCCAVNVPVAVWAQCRELAGIERVAFGAVVSHDLPPPLYTRIEQELRSVRRLLRAATTPDEASIAARRASDFARQLFTTAWELSAISPPMRESLRNRVRLARRAETWMRDHLAEAVQVPDVCLALRVSRRELEYAFRSTFDESPRDFLQSLRLNAIRRALLRRDQWKSIGHIALDHGVTHLSRFAGHYFALFGEYPSETQNTGG